MSIRELDRPLHKWYPNLNINTWYILSLVFMFPEKAFFTWMWSLGCIKYCYSNLGAIYAKCSAMSCTNRPKKPSGWGSPYHRLHVNSLRYSCRKFGFVLPFIFLNPSFAADQLLSACWIWTPVTGSTKLTEWFTVWWLKPKTLCIRLYAAH